MKTLWYGGKFHTMMALDACVEAVVSDAGFIVDTGTKEELQQTHICRNRVDLEGATVFPGFVDSHLHIVWQGEKLEHLDLSVIDKREDVLEAIKERLEKLSDGKWLIAEGWNDNQWEDDRIIDRFELDQLSRKHPIVLTRICRHALVANSLAIELAHIPEGITNPQGGEIVRDHSYRLTGYFKDSAQELIKRAIPEKSVEDVSQLINTSVDYLISCGLVGGHSEDLSYFGPNSYQKVTTAYRESIDGLKRKFRTHLLIHHEVIEDHVKAAPKPHAFIEFGAMKLFVDGALGGRTAWLKEPYSDHPSTYGLAIHDDHHLEELVKKARNHGLSIATHAIGDRAIEVILKLMRKYPTMNRLPDRIIHGMIVNPSLIEQLQQLKVIIDVQPTFVTSDFPWVIDRIGKQRIDEAYPWKTFIQNDIVVAAGSDAPIETVNPLEGIQAFCERRSVLDGNVYGASQRLTRYEAINLYTDGSARAISKHKERGKIAPGFVADFTVLENDPFEVAIDKIKQIPVKMTVVDGTIQYRKKD